jgi:hypothetical protein
MGYTLEPADRARIQAQRDAKNAEKAGSLAANTLSETWLYKNKSLEERLRGGLVNSATAGSITDDDLFRMTGSQQDNMRAIYAQAAGSGAGKGPGSLTETQRKQADEAISAAMAANRTVADNEVANVTATHQLKMAHILAEGEATAFRLQREKQATLALYDLTAEQARARDASTHNAASTGLMQAHLQATRIGLQYGDQYSAEMLAWIGYQGTLNDLTQQKNDLVIDSANEINRLIANHATPEEIRLAHQRETNKEAALGFAQLQAQYSFVEARDSARMQLARQMREEFANLYIVGNKDFAAGFSAGVGREAGAGRPDNMRQPYFDIPGLSGAAQAQTQGSSTQNINVTIDGEIRDTHGVMTVAMFNAMRQQSKQTALRSNVGGGN